MEKRSIGSWALAVNSLLGTTATYIRPHRIGRSVSSGRDANDGPVFKVLGMARAALATVLFWGVPGLFSSVVVTHWARVCGSLGFSRISVTSRRLFLSLPLPPSGKISRFLSAVTERELGSLGFTWVEPYVTVQYSTTVQHYWLKVVEPSKIPTPWKYLHPRQGRDVQKTD